MADASTRHELAALTRELRELLSQIENKDSGQSRRASMMATIAAMSAALGRDLGDAELRVEQLIRSRPVTAAVSAFAIGIAVGLLLRRT